VSDIAVELQLDLSSEDDQDCRGASWTRRPIRRAFARAHGSSWVPARRVPLHRSRT
jgi:hypothetical protein